jgi:branched-chain amino acid transport system substrate-binding protein
LDKKILSLGAIIVAIILVISVGAINQTGFFIVENDETIKIGVVGGFTGLGAYYAQQEQRGVELAVEEINSLGGIKGKKIVTIYEDSEINDAKAVTAIRKLISVDKVNFVIGDSWNATSMAMEPIATENDVILISGVTILTNMSKDDMFFRTVPTIRNLMSELAEYSYESGVRRVGIIKNQFAFGEEHAIEFKKRFIELGGEIVAEEQVLHTQQDMKTELLRIKANNPDGLLNLHTSGAMLGLLAKQAKEMGLDIQLISTFSTENHQIKLDYADVMNGTLYPYTFDTTSELDSIQSFITNYTNKYGEMPDFTAANSYDAMKLIAQAISEIGTNPLEVKKYFLTLTNYEGGSGLISFNSLGDSEREVIIKQFSEGEFVKVK